MTTYVEVCADTKDILLPEVEFADSYWLRFRGLMLRRSLSENGGMLLPKCNAIHCCFMRMQIDVLFLNEDGVILKMIEHMKPWRFSPIVRGARSVLECRDGTVERLQLSVGQRLTTHKDEDKARVSETNGAQSS